MVVETPNPMDMVFNEVGDLVVKVTYADPTRRSRTPSLSCGALGLMLS